MKTYEELSKKMEEAADLRSLFVNMPEVFRYETRFNEKEHYQELQEMLREAAGVVNAWDFADAQRFPDLTHYLLMLAQIVPEIDEEVFDHKMNVVKQYRSTLKALLQVPGIAEKLEAFSKESPEDLPREEQSLKAALKTAITGQEPQKTLEDFDRLRESIRLACSSRVLLREKYERYL